MLTYYRYSMMRNHGICEPDTLSVFFAELDFCLVNISPCSAKPTKRSPGHQEFVEIVVQLLHAWPEARTSKASTTSFPMRW